MAYKTRQAAEALDQYLNIKSTDKKYIPDTKQRGFMLQLESGENIVIFIYPLVHKQDNTKNFFDTRDSGAYERGVAWKFAQQYHFKFFCFGINDEVGKYKDYVFSLECNEAKIEWISGTKNGVRSGSGNQIIIPNDYVPVKKFERITNKMGIFMAVVHKSALRDYLDKYDNRPYMEDEKKLRKMIYDLEAEIQKNKQSDTEHALNKNQIESSQNENSQNESSQIESSQNENSQNENSQNENGQNESSQIESIQNENSLSQSSQRESISNESRQNKSSPNESSLNESIQSKSSPNESRLNESIGNESSPNESSLNEGIQSKSSPNENSFNKSIGNENSLNESRLNESSQSEYNQKNSGIRHDLEEEKKKAMYVPPVYYTHLNDLLQPHGIRYERNRIVFGAPGTGKSHRFKKDSKKLLDCIGGTFERVTFHPDYTYSQFVGTYKPVSRGGDIQYEFVPGPFMRVYAEALRSGRSKAPKPHLLLIEEINRAKVSAVFGDVFQLLDRDEHGVSEYEIHASEDIRRYLAEQLGGVPDNYKKIQLPDNMFIWATMNSADQGVFAMDAAFKRRWNFEYIGINENDKEIRCAVTLGEQKDEMLTDWNRLRRALNDKLAYEYKVNEDKLMGPYFLSGDVIRMKETEAADRDYFIQSFKSKVIMYLYEDAAKQYKHKLFSGSGCDSSRYSAVCDAFDKMGMRVFGDDFKEKYYDVQTDYTHPQV